MLGIASLAMLPVSALNPVGLPSHPHSRVTMVCGLMYHSLSFGHQAAMVASRPFAASACSLRMVASA